MRAVSSQASLALHLLQEARTRGRFSSGRVVLHSRTNSPPCFWSQAMHVKWTIPTLANKTQHDANQQLVSTEHYCTPHRILCEEGGPERDLKHPVGGSWYFVPWNNEHCKSDKTPTKHHLSHSHFVGRWIFGGVGWSQILKECHHFEGNIIYVGAKEISY